MICLHLVWACSRGDSLYLNGTDLRVKVLPYAGVKVPYDLNHKGHNKHKGKEKLFFVLFVAPFFSEPFVTAS